MDRNLRKYASSTTTRLIIGGFILLFVVGLGLIALIYGYRAALMGLICLLAGMLPVGLVALLMFGLKVLVNKINKN